MKFGILYTRIRKDEKRLIESAASRGWEVVLLDDHKITFALEHNTIDADIILERGTHHHRALESLTILESFGIPTVNSATTARICGSKFLSTEALLLGGIPMPKTAIAFTTEKAYELMEEIGYPIVMKPAIGSWGALLSKVNDREAAEAVLTHKQKLGSYHHAVFYLQKFVEKKRDIRVFVVGNKVIGAREFRSDHWSYTLDKTTEVVACHLDDELQQLSLNAATAVKGDVVAVDIIEDISGQRFVIEVEYTMEFSKLFSPVESDAIAAEILDVVDSKMQHA